MTWFIFPWIAFGVMGMWLSGISLSLFSKKAKVVSILGQLFLIGGCLTLMGFVAYMWSQLERAPLRTLGETRLWYSTLLPIIGIIVFYRWKIKWPAYYCVILSSVFIIINLTHPETHDKALMPALQSIWFVPHVVVYMVSYAVLAGGTLVAFHGLYLSFKKRDVSKTLILADQMIAIGFAFLTFGLLFGALWAKEAWGHYWTWDPKETWAFITWTCYLIYFHLRVQHKKAQRMPFWFLAFAFVVILICWFGVNFLPTAQASVHTYALD